MQAREGPGQRLLLLARHLRSPDSGVLGQGVRFLLAGGVVVVVYVTTTIVLADVIGLHFQIALALGFLVAMAVQFTLYRGFVWRHPEYALPMHHQAGRYVTAAAAGYGFSAACTSVLPSAKIQYLNAEVLQETRGLKWGTNRNEVPCLIIEFEGEDISGQTWVQESDGLIVCQELQVQGVTLKLLRD